MLGLADIKDWFKTLNTKADNYYIGKLDNKKDKSIGIYQLKTSRPPRMCIGGIKNSKYGIKSVSVLIHWNKNAKETEQFAYKLYTEILNLDSVIINGHHINYIEMLNNEPVDVGTDNNNVYERVVELNFYYERNEE